MALTRAYIAQGGAPAMLFDALGALAARDDFTELHVIKQHQTLVDEFDTTRAPLRDVHLVAAAKSVACARSGKEETVYQRLQAALA